MCRVQSEQGKTLWTESVFQSTQTFCESGYMVAYGWENGQMAAVFLYGRNTERTGCTGLLQDTFPTRILLS